MVLFHVHVPGVFAVGDIVAVWFGATDVGDDVAEVFVDFFLGEDVGD